MPETPPNEYHAGGGGSTLAYKAANAHLRLWLVAIALLILDLWSKHAIFKNLPPTTGYKFIPGVVEFYRSLNDGAVFGSMTGMSSVLIAASFFAFLFVLVAFAWSEKKQRVLHVALGMVLAGALGNFYDRTFAQADVITFDDGSKFIGLVVDGEENDGYVRIGYWPEGSERALYSKEAVVKIRSQGVVRDFIKFVPHFPKWVPLVGGKEVWPWVFNVADASLVCGVGLLLITVWLTPKQEPRRARHDTEPKEQSDTVPDQTEA